MSDNIKLDWLSRRIDSMPWPKRIDITPVTVKAAELHERNTSGVDRRHWSETDVPGGEEQP